MHLYSLQVIKDLAVSTPHPWLRGHFEGTDRRDPLNVGYRQKFHVFSGSHISKEHGWMRYGWSCQRRSVTVVTWALPGRIVGPFINHTATAPV